MTFKKERHSETTVQQLKYTSFFQKNESDVGGEILVVATSTTKISLVFLSRNTSSSPKSRPRFLRIVKVFLVRNQNTIH